LPGVLGQINSGVDIAIAEKICAYEGIGIPLNLASRAAANKLGKGHECLVTASGIHYTEEQLTHFAYRSFTMRHAFNLREGYRRKDFKIDGRAVGKPPLRAGPLKDRTVDNEKLADNFYIYLGWDIETAMPPKEFLEKVGGLDYVIRDLYPV
jgi:aldehyde:ferredoxin oxidoreductase